MTFNFRSFPYILGILVCMENSQKCRFLLQVVCGNAGINFFRKPVFLQIGVFTKYRWLNATEWAQMPQKLIRTISHGSGHTLDTLNHGLGPLFCCFITLFGAGGYLDPPEAPWWRCPLAPPWTPWCPPDRWYVILSHSQSSWVIMGHI